MSGIKGLAIIDGDIVLFAGSYLTLSGIAKIRQDLTFALHDEYGADISHPYWGSILDRYLGKPVTASLEQQVFNEVQRIINNYISVQADQINSSIQYDIKGVYDTSDVVRNVESIDVQFSGDSITVSVVLHTMARDTVTLSRTVTQ